MVYKSISNSVQYVICTVKLDEEKWKHVGFGSGKWFAAAVKMRSNEVDVNMYKKSVIKYDLTAAQYFWFVYHDDWSPVVGY